jgi:hypothetical protein
MKTAAFLVAAAAMPLMASAQLVIQPSSTSFLDISGTGTSVGTISDDSENTITGAALTSAGFTGNGLLAGGVSVRVGNNGGVLWGNSATDTFGSSDQVGYINSTTFFTMTASNTSILGNGGSGPRQFLAPLWDDNFPGTGASTRWQVIGGDLYIQWTNQDHFNAQGTGTITYQLIVRGGVSLSSGQALVEFVYLDLVYAADQYQNFGGSATIGYKNWTGLAGANDVQYGLGGGTDSIGDPAFGGTNQQFKVRGQNDSGPPGTAFPTALRIIPTPGALALVGMGGLLASRRRR